jgi:putative transposase
MLFRSLPTLIEQDFSAGRPNQKWAADISYLWTGEGWLYLAVVLDLFARRVVGWAMSERPHKERKHPPEAAESSVMAW